MCGPCAANEATDAQADNYPYRNRIDKESYKAARQIIKSMTKEGKNVEA